MSDLTTAAVAFQNAVVEEYRRAVANRGDRADGINRQDAFAHAAEALRARIHSGEIEIPVEDALHSALMAADGREGAAADSILGRVARGEIGMDLWPDPLLEVVVTLGAGRRKPWKFVTAEDVRSMVDLRRANTRAARRAERRFIKDAETVYDDLLAAGTVEQMVAARRTVDAQLDTA